MKSINGWDKSEAGQACKTSITIEAAEGAAFATRRQAEMGTKPAPNTKFNLG